MSKDVTLIVELISLKLVFDFFIIMTTDKLYSLLIFQGLFHQINHLIYKMHYIIIVMIFYYIFTIIHSDLIPYSFLRMAKSFSHIILRNRTKNSLK